MTTLDSTTFPDKLMINAWTGSKVPVADSDEKSKNWGLKERITVSQFLYAPPPIDLRNWQDPAVGWGLVLPDNEQIDAALRATAGDAPEPIRDLLAARPGSPVLRYRADRNDAAVRRYFADGSYKDLQISSASKRGVGPDQLPYYLLIYGGPKVIPWSFHYALELPCFVGRLDLEGIELENYVDALIHGWPTANCDPHQPVVWAVDLAPEDIKDISHLMRTMIAEPVYAKLLGDTQIGKGAQLLTAASATRVALEQALGARHPALIVTTSHGMAGPVNNAVQMAQQLGVLIDNTGTVLDLNQLLAQWQPDGAIWYAHACYSAGSDVKNNYKTLVPIGSDLDLLLDGVVALGAEIAPLPRRLLGAKKPLRAFIGHVEPTFNWTLRQPKTNQVLTNTTVEALYDHMHQQKPEPVGMAFRECYNAVGELYQQWKIQTDKFATAKDLDRVKFSLTYSQLAMLDRQSMVILGDPTVALPAL